MIENTSGRDPLLHLFGSFGDPGRYITEMEAAGQSQLVLSDELPTDTQRDSDEDFLALGFTFGPALPGDSLFRPATLPTGWKRQGSDHDMWSHIVDDKGRKRVAIFYKAAFYDRRAFMRLETVEGHAYALMYGETTTPVLDDEWLTHEALTGALTKLRDREIEDAGRMDATYPEGAAEARARAAVCDKHLTNLRATGKGNQP